MEIDEFIEYCESFTEVNRYSSLNTEDVQFFTGLCVAYKYSRVDSPNEESTLAGYRIGKELRERVK
jgi:hypothetical protein